MALRGDHILLAPPFTITSAMIQMLAAGLEKAIAALEKTHLAGIGGLICARLIAEAIVGRLQRLYRPFRWDLRRLPASGDTNPMVGFSARGAAEEISIEQRFRSLASTEQISKFHRYLTSEPHPAGSARNNELAQWVAEQWRQQGLEDVTIHEYDVLNSRPREISLEMVASQALPRKPARRSLRRGSGHQKSES